jgi:hypothetical protein
MFIVKKTLFAQSIIIDKKSNLVTACNIIEEFITPVIPTHLAPTNLLIYFERDSIIGDSKFNVKVTTSLNDKLLGETNTPIDFQTRKKHRLVVGYNTIPINELGVLKFKIFNEKGKLLHTHECSISPTTI